MPSEIIFAPQNENILSKMPAIQLLIDHAKMADWGRVDEEDGLVDAFGSGETTTERQAGIAEAIAKACVGFRNTASIWPALTTPFAPDQQFDPGAWIDFGTQPSTGWSERRVMMNALLMNNSTASNTVKFKKDGTEKNFLSSQFHSIGVLGANTVYVCDFRMDQNWNSTSQTLARECPFGLYFLHPGSAADMLALENRELIGYPLLLDGQVAPGIRTVLLSLVGAYFKAQQYGTSSSNLYAWPAQPVYFNGGIVNMPTIALTRARAIRNGENPFVASEPETSVSATVPETYTTGSVAAKAATEVDPVVGADPPASSSTGLSTGAIVGIVLAVVAVGVIMLIIGLFLYFRKPHDIKVSALSQGLVVGPGRV